MIKKLHTQVVKAISLNQELIDAMYYLYASYYDETNPILFKKDLQQKNYVLLMYDDTQILRGFTTLSISTAQFLMHKVQIIFSGDTIIHHHFWGEQTLPLAWCRLIGQIKATAPQTPLYWFLIVKGHRTYRYLNIFSKTYYPNRNYSTPADTQQFIDSLAQQQFGKYYVADTGTVQYPQSQGQLKPQWANSDIKKSPEALFFYHKNPHHSQGHELVCLTELSEENLRSFALRGFRQGIADGQLVFN